MSACAPECLSANLDELPSVLDAEQVARVLRVRPARVRELSQNGELSRLAYTRVYLFSSDEVRAFLARQTAKAEKNAQGKAS